jgi:hypothetical protein
MYASVITLSDQCVGRWQEVYGMTGTLLVLGTVLTAAVVEDDESPTLALTWRADGSVRARVLTWAASTPKVLAEAVGCDEDTARAALTVRLAEIVRERMQRVA